MKDQYDKIADYMRSLESAASAQYNKDMSRVIYPEEWTDLMKVSYMGASKYEPNGWMDTNVSILPKVDNLKHIMHHIVETSMDIKEDYESGLHPALHAAWRLLALYSLEVYGRDYLMTKYNLKEPFGGEL